jgi:outer membrane usher protein
VIHERRLPRLLPEPLPRPLAKPLLTPFPRLLFVTICLGIFALRGARAEDVRAIAALIVNGAPQADTTIVWRDGVVWVPAAALQDAGVNAKGVKAIEACAMEIDRVPHLAPANLGEHVRVEWDEHDVALKLTLPPELLPPQTIELPTARPAGMIRPRPISAFVNYAASVDGGRTGLTLETGISLRGKLLRSSVARDLFGRWQRGPTAFVVDDERRLMRWEIGDGVLSGGSLGGAAQVLGVTVSREFGIDPYFVRYTPLTLTGAAATASSAEVYVNGQLVAREAIAPGAFTLRGLLAPVGAGRAEVVLRDAFGREQRLTSSFYQPVTLLRPGLHQFRYGAGARRDDEAAFLRSNSSQDSDVYRGFAAVGDHRVGVKECLTMGGRVEVTDRLVGIAPEVALRAPIGELGVTLAGSRDDLAGIGGAAALGWSWRGRVAGVGATMRGATEEYRSVGVSRLLPAIRREVQAYGGVSLPRGISLVMQHAAARDWAGDRSERSVLSVSMPLMARANFNASVGRSRFAAESAFATQSPGAAQSPSAGRSLSGARSSASFEAFVGVGFRLGPRSSIDTAYSRGGGRDRSTVTYQRSLPIGPGVGARVQWDPLARDAGADAGARALADVDAVMQLQGSAGRVELRHATVGRAEAATGVSVMGAIVAIDGRLHATRPVDDAFGVVKVAEVPGVRTYLSHQYVGRTNARGEVVVPSLVSYYGNRLSIDASDLPLDRAIGIDERIVAPAQRGGAVVRFEALRLRPVIGRIVVIVRGQTIVPAFGDAELAIAGRRLSSPIGVNGEFFIDDLGAGWQRMAVRYDGVRYGCAFDVPDLPRVPGEAIDVGTVTCREDLLRAGNAGDPQ